MGIYKIGAEIETGLKDEKFLKPLEKTGYLKISDDGSIRVMEPYNSIEIQTKPFLLSEKDILFKIIDLIDAQKPLINDSMGFHLHISFKNFLEYQKLYNYKFIEFFKNEYKREFKEDTDDLKRLNNHYSKAYKNETDFNLNTLRQLRDKTKSGSRYFFINFNSFNLYKTIEFRIFRFNRGEKLKQYINFLINVVEKYLKENGAKERFKVIKTIKNKRVNALKINLNDFMGTDKIMTIKEIKKLNADFL